MSSKTSSICCARDPCLSTIIVVIQKPGLRSQLISRSASRSAAEGCGASTRDYAISLLTGRALENSHADNAFAKQACFIAIITNEFRVANNRLFTSDIVYISRMY
jgi:hypothetical protein